MLLRQFISASNAIEEIYIVKNEPNDEANDDNKSNEGKLLPESGTVPLTSMLSTGLNSDDVMLLTEEVEIKSEPPEDDDQEDSSLRLENFASDNERSVSPRKLEKQGAEQEDEDEVPLAQRARKAKHAKRVKRQKSRHETRKKRRYSSSDYLEGEPQPMRQTSCNICRIEAGDQCIFESRMDLKAHLQKKHSPMLPFTCTFGCKSAAETIRSYFVLHRHFEQHNPANPHKCCYCEARFASRIHRTYHQRRFHREDMESDTARNANRRFVCRYCSKRFAARFNLDRHEQNHEAKLTGCDETVLRRNRNRCFLCELPPFGSKQELNAHLITHADKLPYVCGKCTQGKETTILNSIRLVNKHLAAHEEPERPIRCVFCNERFHTVSECQAHERTHASQEQEAAERVAVSAKLEAEKYATKIIIVDGAKRYVCGYCGNSYSLLSTLRRHENIHTGKVQYVCKVCGKIFNKSSCLLQHERTHSSVAPYKCEECGRGFKESIRLIEHRRIHSGERPFSCQYCFKGFRIKPLLKEHTLACMSVDHDQESSCRFCESIFPTFKELSEHIMDKHSITIEDTRCGFCDLRFRDALALAEHENYHRNPNSIRCEVCGRIFKQVSNLRRHQRLHSDDAIPFQCDLCGKSFSQAGALTVHKRIHSGEKPYKCQLCDKKFYHSSTMQRHKRSHYRIQSRLYLFGPGDENRKVQRKRTPSTSTFVTTQEANGQEAVARLPPLEERVTPVQNATTLINTFTVRLPQGIIPVTIETRGLLDDANSGGASVQKLHISTPIQALEDEVEHSTSVSYITLCNRRHRQTLDNDEYDDNAVLISSGQNFLP